MLDEYKLIALHRGEAPPPTEAFYSSQGKGYYKGSAACFIRLGGCDASCHWCDVKESWVVETHPIVPVEDVAAEALKHSRLIIITGGEPPMWSLGKLTALLREGGVRTHIETSGAHPLPSMWDWICLSSKKIKRPVDGVLQQANGLKMVIYNNNGFLFVEETVVQVSPDCLLYLQSEWSKSVIVILKVIDYIMTHPQ